MLPGPLVYLCNYLVSGRIEIQYPQHNASLQLLILEHYDQIIAPYVFDSWIDRKRKLRNQQLDQSTPVENIISPAAK